MLALLKGTSSDLLPILVEVGNEAARDAILTRISREAPGPGALNIGGEEAGHAPRRAEPISIDEVAEAFGPDGAFSRATPGYEVRPQQVEMARAVAGAFNEARILAVEAGTGVGKSLAYLVPAVRYAVANNARVVVSTNTKNLQEQLFAKDLPQIAAALGQPFQYALLKGRSNYICLNRFHAALANAEASLTPDEREAALPLVVWASQTETGDIAENAGFEPGRNGSVWSKVCSDPGFCRSQKCRNNGRCFSNVIRRKAQKAHIAVVNHSLLFSDISTDNGILGDYEHLIVDEAHNVEKVAAHYLGRELTVWRVRNLCDNLRSPGFTGAGTLPALRHWIAFWKLKPEARKGIETGIAGAEETAEDLWLKAQTFFQALTERMRATSSSGKAAYTEKQRYKPDSAPFGELLDPLGAFADAVQALAKGLRRLADWLKDLPDAAFENLDELRGEIESRADDADGLISDIDALTDPDYEGSVYWMELPARESSIDTRLFSAPLDIAEQLKETLYGRLQTIVFTSATLGIRGKMVYFLRRMGLEDEGEDRVSSLCLGSPFDYPRQALVCVPRFVPSPKDPDFQGAVDSLLSGLSSGVGRGTLALYTAYSMLNRSYNALKLDFSSRGILLLGQNIDGERAQITERFRRNGSAVLLGTDSFWEGVDLPGDALQILVIVRLPFAVPTEPLVEAQMELLEKEGKNPFMHYSVPEAILKFRQGFGRLVRTATDRGVVIVLDNRVLTTRYGKAFLEALPVPPRAFDARDDLIEAVADWFDGPARKALPSAAPEDAR
jgi:predicted DnaQ family exonuclease/DinG family helicase